MNAQERLHDITGGRDPHVPISVSTLVGLIDGKCPDVEEVIRFYEIYLTKFPKGL